MSFSNIGIHNTIVERELVLGDSLLDVGAGHGALAYLLRRTPRFENALLVGTDVSPTAARFNEKHRLYDEFIISDHHRLEGRRFHTVACLEVLEHLPPEAPALADVLRALEAHGTRRVILSAPAPFMTFNLGAIRASLREMEEGSAPVEDGEAIERFADAHKQLIAPATLAAFGYRPALNPALGTVNGSIIYVKDLEGETDAPVPLGELLFPSDYLDRAKSLYADGPRTPNREFLARFYRSVLARHGKPYFTPLLPALLYHGKVLLAALLGRGR